MSILSLIIVRSIVQIITRVKKPLPCNNGYTRYSMLLDNKAAFSITNVNEHNQFNNLYNKLA